MGTVTKKVKLRCEVEELEWTPEEWAEIRSRHIYGSPLCLNPAKWYGRGPYMMTFVCDDHKDKITRLELLSDIYPSIETED